MIIVHHIKWCIIRCLAPREYYLCIWYINYCASQVALVVKNQPANVGDLRDAAQIWPPGWENPLEEGMETHSSILAWRIPWTEKPGGLQSMELQRIRHNWSNLACTDPPNKVTKYVYSENYKTLMKEMHASKITKQKTNTCETLSKLSSTKLALKNVHYVYCYYWQPISSF